MGYALTASQMDTVLAELRKDYRVFAPKRNKNAGRFSATDIVKYEEIEKFSDIVWNQQSDYPAKEVLTPIQQAVFYFTEDEFRASKGKSKPILLLARPCDINAQEIQAKIYAGNGGYVDVYYERMKELVTFALMECSDDENSDCCFCCSMGTNKTDNYSVAFRFSAEGALVKVVDEKLAPYFAGQDEVEYEPAFVEENELKVNVPDLMDKDVMLKLKQHPMWRYYGPVNQKGESHETSEAVKADATAKRCISCGACTIACSTCTCFTTQDIIYGDNPEVGERRRISASCQIAGFDQMAGQREFRNVGERMRYKVLHKFRDYKLRFGDRHMCVGCGRCIHRCPQMISIATTLEKVSAAVAEINAELGK